MNTSYYALVDCDGVMYNTEAPAFRDMEKAKIDFNNDLAITNAFAEADWYSLFERGGEINDSVQKVKKALASKEFIDVEILSTFSLYNKKEYRSNEIEAKFDNYRKDLPEIKVNFVPCHTPKHVDQKDRVQKTILFDNSLNNVLGWIKAGGKAALVVKNLQETYPNHGNIIPPYTFGANQPYFIIDDLDNMVAVKKMIIEHDFQTTYFGDDEIVNKVITSDIEELVLSPIFADFLSSLTDKYLIDCYFDYDGVVFDIFDVAKKDINKRLQEIKKEEIAHGIHRNSSDYFIEFKRKNNPWDFLLDDYFINSNWQDLLERARVIDDSFSKIAAIKTSGLFRNVMIASSRNTYLNEGIAKANSSNIYGVTTISIPKKIAKSTALPAKDNILVDDSVSKIYDWIDHNGIGVLFLEQHKFTLPNENRPYYIIGNHDEVIKVFFLEKYFAKKKQDDLDGKLGIQYIK